MRRWLKLSGVVFVGAVCSTLVALFGGRSQPDEQGTLFAALRAESHIVVDGWCWRNLCPGRTTMRDAQAQLPQVGGAFIGTQFTTLRWRSLTEPQWHVELLPDSKLTYVRTLFVFPEQAGLTLGEMIRLYGQPRYVFSVLVNKSQLAWVCFVHDLCATITMSLTDGKLRYWLPVREVAYAPNARYPVVTAWRGFRHYPNNMPPVP
jgi:hypothetical protein